MENDLRAQIEALLFVLSEPVPLKKLSEILNIDIEKIREEVSLLRQDLENENRGLWLIEVNNEIQITTKPEFAGLLEGLIKAELNEELTPSSIDTLSIIAYLGPVSRATVDYIRGVNSTFILRSLLLRGLVQRLDEKVSNAFMYDLSFEFLKHLGISRKEDLPDYSKYEGIGKAINNESL